VRHFTQHYKQIVNLARKNQTNNMKSQAPPKKVRFQTKTRKKITKKNLSANIDKRTLLFV